MLCLFRVMSKYIPLESDRIFSLFNLDEILRKSSAFSASVSSLA